MLKFDVCVKNELIINMKEKTALILASLLVLFILITIAISAFLQTSYGLGLLNKWGVINGNDDTYEYPAKSKSFTFVIGGDVMLGRAVAWKYNNDVSQVFENLPLDVFQGHDLDILNLEGPVSSENITPNPTADNLVFNFPFNSIAALKTLGVNAVSLGNNHSENQGETGLTNTRNLLQDANITSIGSQNSFDTNSVAEFQGANIKMSVITINTLANKDDLTSTIQQEKQKGNLVLVFPHWGNEYQAKHSNPQTQMAHSWIDAGADLVIGSHPHVIQDAEIYSNKPIFYSLGNLVFDQNFSSETQHGLILTGNITDEKITIDILPTAIKNYQVEVLTGAEKDAVITQFKTQIGTQYFVGDSLEISND